MSSLEKSGDVSDGREAWRSSIDQCFGLASVVKHMEKEELGAACLVSTPCFLLVPDPRASCRVEVEGGQLGIKKLYSFHLCVSDLIPLPHLSPPSHCTPMPESWDFQKPQEHGGRYGGNRQED